MAKSDRGAGRRRDQGAGVGSCPRSDAPFLVESRRVDRRGVESEGGLL